MRNSTAERLASTFSCDKAENLLENDEAPDGSFFFRTALHLP